MSPLEHPHRQTFAHMFSLQTMAPSASGAPSGEPDEPRSTPGCELHSGLPDAHAFRRAYQRHATSALRTGEPLTLAMLGAQGLAVATRLHGRAAAEAQLDVAVERIAACFRASDLLARWRDDELVVLLPRTALAGGLRAVEKAIRAVHAAAAVSDAPCDAYLGFSAGVVPVAPPAPLTDAIDLATRLLGHARQRGGARVRWPDGEIALP